MYQLKDTTGEKLAHLSKAYQRLKDNQIDDEMINNINQGYVTVNYDTYEMKQRVIPEIKQSIIMPISYEIMEETLIEKKYPSEYRPKLIFTDDVSETDLTFTLTDYVIVDEDKIIGIRDQMVETIEKLNNLSDLEDIELLISEEKIIAVFSFIYPVIDGSVWQFLFFKEVDGKLLIGCFSCDANLKEEWITIIKQMCLTLQYTEDKGGQTP